jgi:DNA-binding transcriptional MerR regulator
LPGSVFATQRRKRALRDLGLPLQEIPAALEGDPRATLQHHLRRLKRAVERDARLMEYVGHAIRVLT